ncbi:hypothetical protein A1WU_00063 [Escherichia coli KTE108]|nr:hypothetical protein A1WU_00063 [Escherichia coli KTE108]SWS21632.1 Uncharacterised protein [Klebsiella pneumoniae]
MGILSGSTSIHNIPMTELVESKLCRKCKTLKSLLDFGIDRKSKDGHKTRCRQCVAGENRLYKLNNRNVVNAAKNRYRQRHTAEMADYMRLYRARVRGSQLADRHRQHLEFHKEVNIQLQFRLGAIMASQLLQNDKTIEIEKLLLKYLKSPESASGRKALNEARGIAFRAKISYEAFNTLLNTLNRSRI